MTETINENLETGESTAKGVTVTLKEAVAWVKQRMASGQMTLRTLEENTPYKRSTWSTFLNDKYGAANKTRVQKALITFVSEMQGSESLVPVTAFTHIQKMLALIEKDKEMGVIYGKSGTGKTEAAKAYYRSHDNVIYLRCNNAISPRELLKEILGSLIELGTDYYTLNQSINDIQRYLRRKSHLIILDEADQLTVRTLEMVRTIYDDNNCGLILLGEPGIIDLLQHGKQKRANLARLYSRVGYSIEIRRPTLDDVKAVITFRGHSISTELIREIHKVWMKDGGELRRLTKILDRAEDVVAWNTQIEAVNDAAIRGAFNLLVGKA